MRDEVTSCSAAPYIHPVGKVACSLFHLTTAQVLYVLHTYCTEHFHQCLRSTSGPSSPRSDPIVSEGFHAYGAVVVLYLMSYVRCMHAMLVLDVMCVQTWPTIGQHYVARHIPEVLPEKRPASIIAHPLQPTPTRPARRPINPFGPYPTLR